MASKEYEMSSTASYDPHNLSVNNESVLSSHAELPSTRSKYGNMIVLKETSKMLITLGPDYPCTIIAMVLFIILETFTVSAMYHRSYVTLSIVTAWGSALQMFLYLLIALSNPGILTKEAILQEDEWEVVNVEKLSRFCKACNQKMLPRSRHCSDCDVCIKGYDHHCPWTSKCIGENNLWKFYAFAGYTPLFLVYCIVMFSLML